MESYNTFLYNKRLELGMDRKSFAKMIHISHFTYGLIEKGYLKPNKKQVNNIEKYLNVEYKNYLVGKSSYSTDLPEKDKSGLVKWAYDFIGSGIVRFLLIIVFALSIASVIVSIYWTDRYENNAKEFYPEKVVEVYDAVKEKGHVTLDLLDALTRAEISMEDDDKIQLIMIKANYNDSKIGETEFKIDFWSDDCRLTLVFNNDLRLTFLTNFIESKSVKITAKYVDYEDDSYSQVVFYETEKDKYEVIKSTISTSLLNNDEKMQEFLDEVYNIIPFFNNFFEILIEDKLGMKLDAYDDIFVPLVETNIKMNRWENATEILYLVGVIFTLLSLFGLAFSVLYGTKNGARQMSFSNDNSSLIPNTNKLTKSDIKFTPFIPEIALEILGIIIVFVASFRIFFYYSMIIGLTPATVTDFKFVNETFMPLFYLGMFLLYFIDFDTFVEDKRVLRNFFMYLLLFIGLYVLEVYLISILRSKESIIFDLAEYITFPNMFGSIALYFLMMFLLFCTPKVINKKWKLILYRASSLIPATVVLTLYFIFKSANKFWGWELSYDILYLFDSERISFSLLCISYLYGLYFLRLFFKKKYGDNDAKRFFNGNRYIFLKNLMLSIIILVVAVTEYLLRYNSNAVKLGFGQNYYVIFLIPFVMLYHPHKGERNFWTDIMTTILYMLAISSMIIFIGFTLLLT